MPDPRDLKVGDRVRFVAMPDEWAQPGACVPEEDRVFMEAMIKRRFSSRIYEIDEYGHPWIMARLKSDGLHHLHMWAITESTGWRLVKRRDASQS